ncbi:ribosome maturation factor RimP [Thermovenabulum sp.]|uniref:ribosome maturation factor RimP n=1 Tax=Thermovenabulum sp. TaxID=3100335 RepID=UPI003C7ABD16
MQKNLILEKAKNIADEALKGKNYELVDVEFVKEGGNWYLRYYIDKPGGVTLDDCQEVSEEISRLLDIYDPIPQRYILEVSSPGVERPLKKDSDFIRFKGKEIEVKTFEPISGKKSFTGILVDFIDGVIVLKEKDTNFNIPKDKISSARLKFNFKFDEQER